MPTLRAALFLVPALVAASARAADPTTADCLDASERAISLRKAHQLRAARTELLVCASAACPGDIRTECMRNVEEVNASLPTIVFQAENGAGKPLSAVKVSMDGQPLAESLEGTALTIDPGSHKFTFEAPGLPPVEQQLVIFEGAKGRRERIVMGAPGSGSSPGGSEPSEGHSADGGVHADGTTSPGSTQRLIGWTAVAAGGVGLGAGVFFALRSSSKVSERDDLCPDLCQTANDRTEFLRLQDEAKSASTTSTIFLVAGGVLVAGGLALVFTAPSSSKTVAVTPAVGPGFQGIAMTGSIW